MTAIRRRCRKSTIRPPVLFAKGNIDLLARPRQVAVVGTREPSVFGETAAETITAKLGEAGWTIVSGLAIGIDTLAHQTALEVGTPTIAIHGNGLDRVYPKLNGRLHSGSLPTVGCS